MWYFTDVGRYSAIAIHNRGTEVPLSAKVMGGGSSVTEVIDVPCLRYMWCGWWRGRLASKLTPVSYVVKCIMGDSAYCA